MPRIVLYFGVWAVTTACFAQKLCAPLPQPHFHPKTSDPPWLEHVVRLHGHLGPSVVVGARLGMAGLKAVDAKGYFDVEVTCEGPFAKPPESCFLDGVQVATGATLGKRNLRAVEAKDIVLRIRNTRTGKTAELRPSQKLLELLASLARRTDSGEKQPSDAQAAKDREEARSEEVARTIATMPDKELLAPAKGLQKEQAGNLALSRALIDAA
jgi:formylmethanofuran dehydrogenase subunit E